MASPVARDCSTLSRFGALGTFALTHPGLALVKTRRCNVHVRDTTHFILCTHHVCICLGNCVPMMYQLYN